MFIAIEGIDSAGKATQAKMLSDYLSKKGYECIVTQEPMNGPPEVAPIGFFIYEILNNHKSFDNQAFQLLYCADRAYHVNTIIDPALKEGKHVISDRYFLSTIAYGTASGLDKEWIKQVNGKFTMPDIIFIIDMDPEVALKRKKQQKLEQNMQLDMFERQIELMKKIRAIYLELGKEYPNSVVVNGNQTKEEVHKEVIKILETHI